MPRILLLSTTLACLAVATLHGAAQERGIAAQSPGAPATPAPVSTPRVPPGKRPAALATIQGSALTSRDGSLPATIVRLRDARTGEIVATQVTDKSGIFSFSSIDPGSYIAEILGQDEALVLAASQVLHVEAGQTVSAVVKLPFQIAFGGRVRNSTPSAAKVISEAAASGLRATQVSGTATCENLQ